MIVDLHCHSTNSDGTWRVEDILKLAEKREVKVLSITDHDNIKGSQEAQTKKEGLFSADLVPGIEISTRVLGQKVHLLAYFPTPFLPPRSELMENLNRIQNSRVIRMEKMIDLANSMDFKVSFEDVVKEASRSNMGTREPADILSRPHLARVLVDKGYVENFDQAFDLYLADGKPLHVERFTLKFDQWIDQIKDLNGLTIWAHPFQGLDGEKVKLKQIAEKVSVSRIDGVERTYIYGDKYPISHKFEEWGNTYLDELIQDNNWLKTAGGDVHGNVGTLGEVRLPKKDWMEFKERLFSNN